MQKEKDVKSGASRLIDVYIRNNNKQALLVHTPRSANLPQISQLIAKRLRVPPDQQILFYNGQRVAADGRQVQLQDRGIIHLVDRRNLSDNIVINVRRINVRQGRQFRVSASQLIQDFIVRNIHEAERPFLVYTGRELSPRSTFAQEFVENNSEIFCLDEVHDQLTGDKRNQYESRIKKQSKKQVAAQQLGLLKGANDTIKQASLEESGEVTFSGEQRREREEQKTPNFKKKNISEEVNLAESEAPAIQVIPSHQISTSLVVEQLQQNKSSLVPNPLFSEGSSISSICSEENHNPESSKRLDEPSVMFHSAYMGLNNENQLTSRGGSIIANQSDSRQEDNAETASKISFTFDNKAPQMVHLPDRQLTALDREEIIEESKEDYSESREADDNVLHQGKDKENSKDLSGYELQSIEHHQLSASAELEVEAPDSPQKKEQREILIEDFGRQEDTLGDDIEPIAYSHHQIHHHNTSPCTLRQSESMETPHFDEAMAQRQLEVYVIEQSELAGATESEAGEEKEERQTNRHSSNFYSSNSSRAKQYDPNNEYNFGQFQRYNHNRFSNYRQHPNHSEVHSSKSERSHVEPIEEFTAEHLHTLAAEPAQNNRKKSIEDEHSLNIVELPIEARIKENSSLLIDYDSRSQLNNFRACSKLERQGSGIDELNQLLAADKAPPSQESCGKEASGNSGSVGRESAELVQNQHQKGEEVIETSLNMRMSRRQSREEANSPVVIDARGVIDSAESLQKIEVKNSMPYFNSYSRSISSEVRFTNHREVYNIGDFVFNCANSHLSPLAYFVETLSREEALDIYHSYP